MPSNNFFIFFTYISMPKDYQNNKERLQKKPRERCLSKEEKEKKKKYVCEQYKNLPEDEKLRLFEHRKNTVK